MIRRSTPYYPNDGPQGMPAYGNSEEAISSSLEANPANPETNSTSFLYYLSVLKDRVHQVHSLASIFLSPDQTEPTAVATVPTMGTLIQEIIVTASNMMSSCQQMAHGAPPSANNTTVQLHHHQANEIAHRPGPGLVQSCINPMVEVRKEATSFYSNHHETLDQWYGHDNRKICNSIDDNNDITTRDSTPANDGSACEGLPHKADAIEQFPQTPSDHKNHDIIEIDAASLLAKYTHYCQVCGKGFKRGANLRMHMRAHGDEYKSSAALSNPTKIYTNKLPKKLYSCPQEGCRWNQKHSRFQPLKSMVCVKNHYKRSHCPKMYACKRCSRKQFSVLSDLRTHEKHCGDVKWRCSCGTTFSRKDKLMGHVALFVGHTPAGD